MLKLCDLCIKILPRFWQMSVCRKYPEKISHLVFKSFSDVMMKTLNLSCRSRVMNRCDSVVCLIQDILYLMCRYYNVRSPQFAVVNGSLALSSFVCIIFISRKLLIKWLLLINLVTCSCLCSFSYMPTRKKKKQLYWRQTVNCLHYINYHSGDEHSDDTN